MLSFHQVVESEFNQVNELILSQLHSDVGLVENIGQYIIVHIYMYYYCIYMNKKLNLYSIVYIK